MATFTGWSEWSSSLQASISSLHAAAALRAALFPDCSWSRHHGHLRLQLWWQVNSRGGGGGGDRRLLATCCLDIADLFYQICWVLCYKSPNGCKRVVFGDYVDHYRDSRLHCNRFVTTATLNKRTIPFPWYWCCRTRSSWWQYHTLQSCPVMGSFGEMRSINLMRTTRWIFLWRYFTFFTPTTSKAGWCWSQSDLYFISPLLWLEGFSVASIVSRYFELPNKLLPDNPES